MTPEIIVIAGKGGVGKTTFAALLTLALSRRSSGSVLAVDADPNSNLADALGLKDISSIADVVDAMAKNPDIVPASMGKDAFIEYRIHEGIAECDGFDVLAMGRPEGPGCYCYINNVLRHTMVRLTSDYSFVVVDNEAGMEHFSRKTMRSCSRLFVVSDETAVGLRSARRILSLVEELGIVAKKKYLVVNRAVATVDSISLKKDFGVEDVFVIPFDGKILEASTKAEPLADIKNSDAIQQIVHVGDVLCRKH
jgi:CO dehydrogenase maturation factor